MWQRIKNSLIAFMTGRHGTDQLSMASLILGLIITLIAGFIRISIVSTLLSLLGTALYVWTIFRVFSRNNTKRYAENMKYLSVKQTISSEVSQFIKRSKNIKKYKYFKCPECKSRLRLPRKVGEVTVTCGKCKHQFKQKA